MSLDTTASSEGNMLREAESAHRFVSLYHNKGYIEALDFHASLEPYLKDYVTYSIVSQRDYEKARQEVERGLRC